MCTPRSRGLAVDQDRKLAVREHLGGFAADQQAGDAAAAVGGHENQVALVRLRGLDDRLVRRVAADLRQAGNGLFYVRLPEISRSHEKVRWLRLWPCSTGERLREWVRDQPESLLS